MKLVFLPRDTVTGALNVSHYLPAPAQVQLHDCQEVASEVST